jgi:hypothetical protein
MFYIATNLESWTIMGRNGVLGIVVPIDAHEVMHDVFHGKSVHASLAQGESTDLERGDRIFFYDSRETHSLMGEAVITDIAFEEAKAVNDDLEGALYLEKADFERYVSSLPEGDRSKLRVLHFKEPILYANPVKCSVKVAENGTYMTAEVSSRIAKENL